MSFIVIVYILSLIGFERGLAQATDIGGNLKAAHHALAAFPKRFVVDIPADTQRTERCISFIVSEFRRTVQTTGEIQHINVVVRVIHIEESTGQTRHPLLSGRYLIFISVTERDIVHIPGRKTNDAVRFILITGFLHIGSYHRIDKMISERLVVAEYGIHLQIGTLLPHTVSLSFFQNSVSLLIIVSIVLGRPRIGKLFLLVSAFGIGNLGF